MKECIALDVLVIERARKAKGLFKRELAAMAGVSRSSVCRAFATGHAGLKVARGIARSLGLEVGAVLLDGQGYLDQLGLRRPA